MKREKFLHQVAIGQSTQCVVTKDHELNEYIKDVENNIWNEIYEQIEEMTSEKTKSYSDTKLEELKKELSSL